MTNEIIRNKTYNYFKNNQKQFIYLALLILLVTTIISSMEKTLLMNHFNIAITLDNYISFDSISSTVTNYYDWYTRIVETIFGLMNSLFLSLVSIGILKGYDKGEYKVSDSALYTDINWAKLALITILSNVIISLFTLLLIIPGIIATYALSIVIYLFYDHPGLSSFEILALSHTRMKGNKWGLLMLQLSYLVWVIAAFLVMVLVSTFSSILAILAWAVFLIVSAYFYMLIEIAHVVFYNEVIRQREVTL